MALVILLTTGILAAAIAAHFFPEDAGAGSASGSDAGDADGRDRAKDFAVGLIVVFCAVLCVPALGGDCRPECTDESVRNRVQEALRREGKAWRANRRRAVPIRDAQRWRCGVRWRPRRGGRP